MSWDTHWDQRPEESRRLDAALAVAERVRALHARYVWTDQRGETSRRCLHDEFPWPCPTIRALGEAE